MIEYVNFPSGYQFHPRVYARLVYMYNAAEKDMIVSFVSDHFMRNVADNMNQELICVATQKKDAYYVRYILVRRINEKDAKYSIKFGGWLPNRECVLTLMEGIVGAVDDIDLLKRENNITENMFKNKNK